MPRKATKKETTSAKKTAPKKKHVSADRSSSEKKAPTTSTTLPSHNKPSISRKQVFILVCIIIFLAVLYSLQSVFVVAKVNGSPISRWHLLSELQKQDGKQVLDQIITQEVVEQQAAKLHITVSNQEVSNEMNSLENQVKSSGQSLDDVLAMQGMTRSDLENNIRLQELVEKMAAKNITVTNKEIDDYIAQNKDTLPAASSAAAQREAVRKTILQQKQTSAIQDMIQKLKSEAKIDYLDNSLKPS